MAKEPKLTKRLENALCRAYERSSYLVIGGAPKTKEDLLRFNYITRMGVNKNGYDEHVLSPAGIDRAVAIMNARKNLRTEVDNRITERNSIKVKAALLDEVIETLTDPEMGTKTFYLRGWKIRFDRSGPSKLIVQVTKP